MANDKQNTSPNVPNLREQSGIYSGDAERGVLRPQGNVPNKGNVPRLRFPEFTEDWTRCTIGDYGNVITGSTPSTNDAENYDNGTYLWASPADLGGTKYIELTQTKLTDKGFAKTRCFPANSILVTCIGSTIGKMGMSKIAMSTNQQINTIVPTGHDANFVYYALQSRFPRYLSSIAVQAVPIISKSAFEKLENHTTQIDEQNKIGSFLSLLDERINTQNKIIEQLQSLIKGIYDNVFTNFSEYNTLSTICKIQKGQQVNGEELFEYGEYYVMNGGIEPSGYYDKYNTLPNTISISEGGNSCGYVQFNTVPFWSGGHCYSLQDINIEYSTLFVYHYLKSKEKEIMALRIGSGLPNIQKKDLEKFPIPVLSLEIQISIVNGINKIETKLKHEKDILSAYQTQKAYLLRNLFI